MGCVFLGPATGAELLLLPYPMEPTHSVQVLGFVSLKGDPDENKMHLALGWKLQQDL